MMQCSFAFSYVQYPLIVAQHYGLCIMGYPLQLCALCKLYTVKEAICIPLLKLICKVKGILEDGDISTFTLLVLLCFKNKYSK